jgi:hypothetical protein
VLSAHNYEPYYRPNEDTRLAFDARGIYHLSRAPDRNAATDLNQRLLFRIDVRALLAARFSGRGNPGVIRETRDLMGANSPEWAATRRSAVEQILDTGRDQTRQAAVSLS